MPLVEPIIAEIWLTEQPDGRWRARASGHWGIVVRQMRVPQAAVSLVIEKLRTATGAGRTETNYRGPGTNYGHAGLYVCTLFSETQQPKG